MQMLNAHSQGVTFKHEYKGVSYVVVHTRTPSADSVTVWRGDYLVGNAEINHDHECIDIMFQKPEHDFHETNVIYELYDDVKQIAEYIMDC